MEKDKLNKSYVPAENKAGVQVRIRFMQGRMGEGAVAQADGTHLASEQDAAYWVSIGYAEYVKEKGE
jgi:hypothetical protein